MNLFDSFAAAFDCPPSVSFLGGETEIELKPDPAYVRRQRILSAAQRIIDDPEAPDGEREAAQRVVGRLLA